MSWWRRVLSRWVPEALPPAVAPADHVDLVRAKVEQLRISTRANVAIQEALANLAIQAAMAHADEAFVPRVERRQKPR
jgi:hypothetical protein